MHDTEDRYEWYGIGENLERHFVDKCRSELQWDIMINPEKEIDPTVPDLIYNGQLADLKTQQTPFFTASRYGIDPQFAVTFNRKDYVRYSQMYPELIILFWVDWQELTWRDRVVEYHGGIYVTPFREIVTLIENGAKEHFYSRRRNDNRGNAKSSFIFDVRNFQSLVTSHPPKI